MESLNNALTLVDLQTAVGIMAPLFLRQTFLNFLF